MVLLTKILYLCLLFSLSHGPNPCVPKAACSKSALSPVLPQQTARAACLQSSECPTKCKWIKTVLVDFDDLLWLLHRVLHFPTYCISLLSLSFRDLSCFDWLTIPYSIKLLMIFLISYLWSFDLLKNFMASWNALLLFNADTYQTGVNRLKLYSKQDLIWNYIKRRICPSFSWCWCWRDHLDKSWRDLAISGTLNIPTQLNRSALTQIRRHKRVAALRRRFNYSGITQLC